MANEYRGSVFYELNSLDRILPLVLYPSFLTFGYLTIDPSLSTDLIVKRAAI
jgi:hypothetical protein